MISPVDPVRRFYDALGVAMWLVVRIFRERMRASGINAVGRHLGISGLMESSAP